VILFFFTNNLDGFQKLYTELNKHAKDGILIGMENTGHYNFDIESNLLTEGYKVALINPITTMNFSKASLKTNVLIDILFQNFFNVCCFFALSYATYFSRLKVIDFFIASFSVLRYSISALKRISSSFSGGISSLNIIDFS